MAKKREILVESIDNLEGAEFLLRRIHGLCTTLVPLIAELRDYEYIIKYRRGIVEDNVFTENIVTEE